jgi:hypothetical protein
MTILREVVEIENRSISDRNERKATAKPRIFSELVFRNKLRILQMSTIMSMTHAHLKRLEYEKLNSCTLCMQSKKRIENTLTNFLVRTKMKARININSSI